MKKNQIESYLKCLLVKTYVTKKALRAHLMKKAWHGVLKMDTRAAVKHKIILPWPRMHSLMRNAHLKSSFVLEIFKFLYFLLHLLFSCRVLL